MARRMLKEGDAVTVVQNGRAVVQDFVAAPSTLATSPGAFTTDDHVCQYEDEGVTWLRGHFGPDAEEVTAARAALALREGVLDKPAREGAKSALLNNKALLGSLVGAAIGGMIGGTFDKKKGP